MTTKEKRSDKTLILTISAVVAVLFIAVVAFGVKILISDDGQKRKRQIQMVTLVKPPPPPKIKEKPPEPEVKKKEEVVEPEPEEPEPEPTDDQSQDDAPPGDDLGLDADGTGGADGFGLKARKGGRSLIGGGLGKGSLLRKYGWYTRIIQDDLRKQIHDHLAANGGVPDVSCRVALKISLDSAGNVTDFKISDLCGNEKVDRAVKEVLGVAKISEPPPADMPKTVKLRISSKG